MIENLFIPKHHLRISLCRGGLSVITKVQKREFLHETIMSPSCVKTSVSINQIYEYHEDNAIGHFGAFCVKFGQKWCCCTYHELGTTNLKGKIL